MAGDTAAPVRYLTAYPFPVAEDVMARLELPSDGLRPDEAERLIAFIMSLVIDPEEHGDGN